MRYQLKQIHCRPWTLSGLSLKLIESHYENNYGGALRRLNAITEQLEALDFANTPGSRHQRPEARGAGRAQFDAAARALLREHGRRRHSRPKAMARGRWRATSARSSAGATSSSRWATRSAAARAGCCSPISRATGGSSTSTRPSTRRRWRAACRSSRSTCTSTRITWTSAPTPRRTSIRSCATSTGRRSRRATRTRPRSPAPRPLEQPEFGDMPGVGVEEVKAMLDAGKPVQVIDVRPRRSVSRQQDIAEGVHVARSRSAPGMDRRAVEVGAGGRVLRLRLPRRLQDRDQAARRGVRREVHERRPLRLEGDRRPDQDEAMSAALLLRRPQIPPRLLPKGASMKQVMTALMLVVCAVGAAEGAGDVRR